MSQSPVSYTCEGGNFSLDCSTNGTNLVWAAVTDDNSDMRLSTFISRNLTMHTPPDVTVSNTRFLFSKSSNSPLTSTMLVENVTSDVDGVRVECEHQGGIESTTIRVIKCVTNNYNRTSL